MTDPTPAEAAKTVREAAKTSGLSTKQAKELGQSAYYAAKAAGTSPSNPAGAGARGATQSTPTGKDRGGRAQAQDGGKGKGQGKGGKGSSPGGGRRQTNWGTGQSRYGAAPRDKRAGYWGADAPPTHRPGIWCQGCGFYVYTDRLKFFGYCCPKCKGAVGTNLAERPPLSETGAEEPTDVEWQAMLTKLGQDDANPEMAELAKELAARMAKKIHPVCSLRCLRLVVICQFNIYFK